MLSLSRSLVAAAALGTFAALPATANASVSAFATGNVNMRTCGSTSCPRVTTVPVGAPVVIYQCTSGYGWCDTQYGGYRGWVSGRYLQANAPGYSSPSPLPAIGALLGIGIIGAAIANNNYYNYNPYPYYYPGWRPPYNYRPYPYRPYPVKPWTPPRGGYSPSFPGGGSGSFGRGGR
ncbi:SH3 domain-containing protein [Microbaculum marinum]|uniref:SH3 domain-containing protein n=1 Tax=Microbaculum marinum TaxID=1764581 RepID=A0AAW9RXC9_9HYPH